jgi:hypothetical protein
MKYLNAVAALLTIAFATSPANAQDLANEVDELRHMLTQIQQDYEQRIGDLEDRLARAERLAGSAKRDADEAIELVEQTAIDLSSGTSAPNTFNPSVGAVLVGQYANSSGAWDAIPGFQAAGEIGTADNGFSIGEGEINLKANVDSRYFGNLTMGLAEDDGEASIEIEEAWFQTTALPSGFSLMAGRFFSAAGYLNSFHFHADDFVDRPLPYQAFFGGRYSVDGLQARWIAPTSFLFELGTEANWGESFPATSNANSSPSAWTAFANIGGDLGDSHSWQFGLAQVNAEAIERSGSNSGLLAEAFTGDSDLSAIDFVWKWAPLGNSNQRSLKLQGEYFRRSETGMFNNLPYNGDQSGWYLQGVWQFAGSWRVGARHDLVDADNGAGFIGTSLEDSGRSSSRDSMMLDWSPSEFSRLRLQYTKDKVLAVSDDQWFIQYIMSVGAHGAHKF